MEKLIQSIEEQAYLERDILKLKAIEFTAETSKKICYNLLIGLVLLFVLITFSIGSAMWVNHKMENNYVGFFIVSSCYIFICFILLFLRETIQSKVKNNIIKHLLN